MFVRISQIHIFSFLFVHFNKSSVSNFPSKIFKKMRVVSKRLHNIVFISPSALQETQEQEQRWQSRSSTDRSSLTSLQNGPTGS